MNRYEYYLLVKDNNEVRKILFEWANSSMTAENALKKISSSVGLDPELPNAGVVRYLAKRMTSLTKKSTVFGVKYFGEAKASRSRKLRNK